MPEHKDRRVIRTRRSIWNAFVTLMQQKDISEITVTELARVADIDRKTFYQYYDNIMDVYRELEKELSDELQQLLKEDEVDFEHFFRSLNEIMEKDLSFYKVIASKSSYTFLVNQCTDLLACKLTERFEKSEGHITDEMKVRIDFAACGIIGVYIRYLRGDAGRSLDELIPILSSIAEHVLLSSSAS